MKKNKPPRIKSGTTVIEIGSFRIHASGSRVKPYANLYIDSRSPKDKHTARKPHKPLNLFFRYVTLGSGKKVWRWSNETPKWLVWLLETKNAIKHRNAWNVDWDDQKHEFIELPPVSKWVVIRNRIKQLFCKHNWEVEDHGDAESGPCLYGVCTKCGKTAGPHYHC